MESRALLLPLVFQLSWKLGRFFLSSNSVESRAHPRHWRMKTMDYFQYLIILLISQSIRRTSMDPAVRSPSDNMGAVRIWMPIPPYQPMISATLLHGMYPIECGQVTHKDGCTRPQRLGSLLPTYIRDQLIAPNMSQHAKRLKR